MVSTKFLEGFLKHLRKLEISHIEQVVRNIKGDLSSLVRILDTLPECLIALKKDLSPLFYNQKALDFFYLKENEWENLDKISLYPALLEEILEMTKNKTFLNQKQVVIEGFSPIILEIGVYNFKYEKRESGKEEQLAHMIIITDKTYQEKEIQQKQIKQNILSMDHLAAGLAHEIKNPLTAIKLYLEILRRTSTEIKDSSVQKEIIDSLRVVEDEVLRLNDITSDFLTTIRPLSLDLQTINLHEFMKSLVEIFKVEMGLKKIIFTIKEQENLPQLVGDPKYLKMVFINLIKNAIEAYEGESTLQKKEILLTIEENTPFIEISIKDHGGGIAPTHLKKIFEPYFTTKKNGVGIGLSMVYKIISEHQGSIQVQSHKDKGTIFSVFLPLYRGSIRKFLNKKTHKTTYEELENG
jgi:two-component system, sporulation sensor kinase E